MEMLGRRRMTPGYGGIVKRKDTVRSGAIALACVAAFVGCKNDEAAIKALEELTTQLAEQVEAQNEKIAGLTGEVETCMKDLANTKGEAVVLTSSTTTVSVPSLEGESTKDALEALKKALNDASDTQKAAIEGLEMKKSQCVKDLEAARAEAEAAAEAKAAAEAEAAAKKEAARPKRKPAEKKPTAVKKAEEEGTPTKGVRSRY